MKKILLLFIPLIAACSGVKDARICEFKDGRQAAVSLTFGGGLADDCFLIAAQRNTLGVNGNDRIIVTVRDATSAPTTRGRTRTSPSAAKSRFAMR